MANIAFYLWGQAQRTEIYLHSIDERERKLLNGEFKNFSHINSSANKKGRQPCEYGKRVSRKRGCFVAFLTVDSFQAYSCKVFI